MANNKLKRTILEIVNNQLKDNDPPCTKKAYEQLMAAGYTEKETKEKIGAVVLEEIYDVIKANEPFDEQRFEIAITNMVQQCIDFEDDHRLPSEWDEIGKLINQGQTCLFKNNYPGMTKAWLQAWQLTRSNVKQAEYPIGIHDLEEATDYEYSFEGWLQDMEMELSNAKEHEKRLQFCQEVLETFIWNQEDYGGFKVAIGESLYAMKKEAEGRQWFDSWLKEEPHNVDAINGLVFCLQRTGEISEAFQIVEKEIKGKTCTFENDILFVRATELAEMAGAVQKKDDYEKQYQSFKKEAAARADFNYSLFNGYKMPNQMPVRKTEKIYPNDKCPCGSGKKYKKCCGR